MSNSIETQNHKLVLKALNTVPIKPVYSSVGLKIDRIPEAPYDDLYTDVEYMYPSCGSESGNKYTVDRYIKQCLENRVIPFSELGFVYDRDSGIFVPDKLSVHVDYKKLPKNKISNLYQSYISGGRPHLIGVDLDGEEEYNQFCRNFLNYLLERGYKIYNYQLDLLVYQDGTDDVVDSSFEVHMLGNGSYSLDLYLGNLVSNEFAVMFSQWFEE